MYNLLTTYIRTMNNEYIYYKDKLVLQNSLKQVLPR